MRAQVGLCRAGIGEIATRLGVAHFAAATPPKGSKNDKTIMNQSATVYIIIKLYL